MSDYPWLTFEIEMDGKVTKFIADPVELHERIVSGVKKQLAGGINQSTPEEAKTKIRIVKTTIKAFLIAAGDILLDFVYGAKNYTKRGKKDDIYEWYVDAYVRAAIDMALQGTIVLHAKEGEYGQSAPIIIDQICPKPLAGGIGGTGTGEGEGSSSDEEPSGLECFD